LQKAVKIYVLFMIYPIYLYGTSVLRKKTKEIPKDYRDLGAFVESMFETMNFSDGIGLAAPQVGKSLRLFVVDATEMEDEEGEGLADFKVAFINPVIVEESGEVWAFNEGCLSIPGIREEVERVERVRIRYYDVDWNLHDEIYTGIKARIIQHEYDHLEGILFTDKINPLRKRLINGKLQAIAKGKVDTEYKIVASK
jgi:peptide deformylase